MSTYRKKDHCHYSGLPSPMAYEKKKSKITIMKETIFKWYPVIIAFMCLLYSVGLGYLVIQLKLCTQHIGPVQYYYLQ